MFLKAASRAPVTRSQMALLTRRRGDTSTACRRTVPARPIRVESSRGPLLMIASVTICNGFCPVRRWMISKACLTIRIAINFFPLFLPCIINELVNRSTIGHCAFPNRLAAYAGRVGEILGELLLDGDVISQADVVDNDIVRTPLVEQLDLRQLWSFHLNGRLRSDNLFVPVFSRHFWIRN